MMEEYCVNEEVTPGIHQYARQKVKEFFNAEQQSIVRRPQWGQVLERGYKKKKSRAKI